MLHSFSRRAIAVIATAALGTGLNLVAFTNRAYAAGCGSLSVTYDEREPATVRIRWYNTTVPALYSWGVQSLPGSPYFNQTGSTNKTSTTSQTIQPLADPRGLKAGQYHVFAYNSSNACTQRYDQYIIIGTSRK